MRNPSLRKIAFAAILILAVFVATLSASPLKPWKGFGDAKVYDSSYKAMPSPTEVSDGYVIRTSKDSLILDNGSTHVELDSNSLAVFINLESGVQIYILDGRILVSSDSGDFTVMTTVTTYNAKSGSSIYVVTDATDELAFVSDGSAQAQNFILGTSTEIPNGNYIDNAVSGFTPSQSSVRAFWREPEVVPQEIEKETETETKSTEPVRQEPSPLTRTFSYGGFKATITAYNGYAELTYPVFVTDKELQDAAAAAFNAYPQYMEGIYYQIVGPGKVALYYPENYGEGEFNLAMNLINAELPAYIASVIAPKEQTIVASSEVPSESVAEEPKQEQVEPVETPAPQTEKTPLETVPRPEEIPPEPEKESNFKFGLWAGGVYAAGKDGDTFTSFPYTNGLFGSFWKDFTVFVRPYIKYKNFIFGLNLEAKFVDAEIQTDNYKFDTENGIPGYINSVAKYISVIGYDGEAFKVSFDLTSDLNFASPIVKSSKRLYTLSNDLLGSISLKAGIFSLDAFVDDLKLTSMLNGSRQFAGLRAGLTLGSFNIGLGAVANFGEDLESTLLYPSVDLSVPFTLMENRIKISASGAAQIGFEDGFKLYGLSGKAMIGIGYGVLEVGFGAQYNKDRHFSDLITNAPVSTASFTEGSSVDAVANITVDTKVFDFRTAFSVPVSLDGGGFRNQVKTRSGLLVDSTPDTFDLQMDLTIGSFKFTIGSSIYGFAGKVSEFISAASDDDERSEALKNIVSPDMSKIFAVLDFNTPIGSGNLDVFVRADLDRVEEELRFPISLGASYSF